MSAIKDQLDKEQDYHKIAYDILLEVGAIKECDFPSDYYCENFLYDEKTIYGMCTNRLQEKYGLNQDYEVFHSQIAEILRNSAIESSCPYCEKE